MEGLAHRLCRSKRGQAFTAACENDSCGRGPTYSKNSGIIRHFGRFVLRGRGRSLDAEVLHIAASEDNIVVNLIGGRNLLVRVASPTLGAVGRDIFQGNGRLFGVDLVQDTRIPIAVG